VSSSGVPFTVVALGEALPRCATVAAAVAADETERIKE
jgi:hypothetical protein